MFPPVGFLLQKRSLKSLRRLLLAFRAAAHSNEDGEDAKSQAFAYDIEDPKGSFASRSQGLISRSSRD